LTTTIYLKYLPLIDHHDITEIPPFEIATAHIKGRYFSYIVVVNQREVFQVYRGGQSKGGISVISWRSIKGRYFSYIVGANQKGGFKLYLGGQSKGGILEISWGNTSL
jgi:hypothetical protein